MPEELTERELFMWRAWADRLLDRKIEQIQLAQQWQWG